MARVFKDQRDSAQIDHASNFTEGKDLIPEFNFSIAAEAGCPRSDTGPRMTYNRQMTNDVISNAFFMVQNGKVSLGIHLLETFLRVFPYHINKKNRRKATIDTTRTLTTALGDSGRLIGAPVPIKRQIAANITASRFDLLLPSSLSTGTRSNTPDALHLFLFFARPRSSLSCGPCVILATSNW